MNQILLTAWVLLFPAGCTALGAAGVFLLRRTARPCTQRILCGMAAGIMLAASVWSLLLPAIERARQQAIPAWIAPSIALVLGAVGLLQLEQAAGELLAGGSGHGGRMVLAVTLHNLPEGMVAGLAAALALTGEPDAVSGALALHLAKMTPMLANIDAESLDLSGVTEITVDETMIVGTIKREEEL